LSALARLVGELGSRKMGFCLIGAGALAARGVARSTFDLDLLTTDRRALASTTWDTLRGSTAVDIELGDDSDPLAGVVRFGVAGERPIDLIVGRQAWQREVIERADRLTVGGLALPVARAADLVLLKLYAGGPQDAWDVQQLAAAGGTSLAEEVEFGLSDLPPDARELWTRLRGSRA